MEAGCTGAGGSQARSPVRTASPSSDDKAPTTGAFGEVNSVRSAQRLCTIVLRPEQGHSRAERRRHAGNAQDHFVRERDEVTGDRFDAARVGIAEQDNELVPADSQQDIAATQVLTPCCDEVPEDVAAGA